MSTARPSPCPDARLSVAKEATTLATIALRPPRHQPAAWRWRLGNPGATFPRRAGVRTAQTRSTPGLAVSARMIAEGKSQPRGANTINARRQRGGAVIRERRGHLSAPHLTPPVSVVRLVPMPRSRSQHQRISDARRPGSCIEVGVDVPPLRAPHRRSGLPIALASIRYSPAYCPLVPRKRCRQWSRVQRVKRRPRASCRQ